MSILDEIVEKRRADIARFGYTFACDIPAARKRKAPVPFVAQKGAVLEVKRASPSKGDIAPALDAAATATTYAAAGAAAISVLTEKNYFKGSLVDLMAVCAAVDAYAESHEGSLCPAVLRKDFLLAPEEVDIAYRAGADAVLLIARLLEKDVLLKMAERCAELGMTAFIELRLDEDVQKLAFVAERVDSEHIVCGVNARDLRDFSIDLLTPAGMLPKIQRAAGQNVRVIFESGIRTPEAASFAGGLGFTGMLLGEAAARNPAQAAALVESFVNARQTAHTKAWLDYAHVLAEENLPRPLVKICGLTNMEDVLAVLLTDAMFLGFIFCAKSPRNVDASVVREARAVLSRMTAEEEGDSALKQFPKLVGIIIDCESAEAKTALALAREGVLDFIQLHGERAVEQFFSTPALQDLPHYAVVNVSSEEDIAKLDALRERGEPRILIDAVSGGLIGGTGTQIAASLVSQIRKKTRLWLAGGVTPENARNIIEDFEPELIDVASGVEEAPGRKDLEKLDALFACIAPAEAEV